MTPARQVTYHPIVRWRCSRCGAAGEVICSLSDTVETRWRAVLDAHLDESEACVIRFGDAGISVHSESGSLPD